MGILTTDLCRHFGIEHPIFGFAHDIATVAAITNAGGLGVYGATRRFPHEIDDELAEIRRLVGDKPFGVDTLLPAADRKRFTMHVPRAPVPKLTDARRWADEAAVACAHDWRATARPAPRLVPRRQPRRRHTAPLDDGC